MPLEKKKRSHGKDTRRRVYRNLPQAGFVDLLFARRPRFISMTRGTYLPDERLNWNKQIPSMLNHLHV
jgi:hypothetical protein